MHHVVIIGCGDIGRRVAQQWRQRGAQVCALARSHASAQGLAVQGITPIAGDLDQPQTLGGLELAGTLLYYFAPPTSHGLRDERVRALVSSHRARRAPARIVYISTSGVYGDHGGAVVTEQTPPAPRTERARRRLDAEQVLQQWSEDRGIALTVLRVGGIYGPGRLPEARLREGAPVLRADQAAPSNRIHADDLAAVCVAAGEPGRPTGIYNVCDGQPGTMTEYFLAVADVLGLPRPPEIDREQAGAVMSLEMMSYLSESRRMDNRRMRDELGITLRYPDLASGLVACLNPPSIRSD